MLRLSTPEPDNQLPLTFEQYEHLKGDKSAYVDGAGTPLSGAQLDARLRAEGAGKHTVTITGKYADEGGGSLIDWSQTVPLAGPLDADTLARVAHQTARQVIEKRSKKQGTPPEHYLTGYQINEGKPRKGGTKRTSKRAIVRQYVMNVTKGKKVAVYRDRTTGRFRKRSEWEQS